jgi:hypothetical protein
MGRTRVFSGWISHHDWREGDALFLSNELEPLAHTLEYIINEIVTIRYWVTDQVCTLTQAEEAFGRKLFGDTDVELDSVYSEITGYLWTNEWLRVGGHDLIDELMTHEGKYAILEVTVHDKEEAKANGLVGGGAMGDPVVPRRADDHPPTPAPPLLKGDDMADKTKSLWLVLQVHEWDGLKTNMGHPIFSPYLGCSGCMYVFDTERTARAAFPDAEVLEVHGVQRDASGA